MSDNTTINPFSLEPIKAYSFDSIETSRQKLKDADDAFGDWSKISLSDRCKYIKEFGAVLSSRKQEVARLMVQEMGKPITQALGEVDRCLTIIDYSIEHASDFLEDKIKKFSKGRALTSYSPQGVILGIQPWNFPLYQVIRYTIPNLLAGNTVLLKHARNVWGCALKVESLFKEAGLMHGAFGVLKMRSEDMDFIYQARQIRGINFTGSSDVGRKIAAKAGENLKKTVLELGGNDAYIVLKDADLDRAVEQCFLGRINNNGQTCIAAKRLLIEESIYDQFKSKFIEKVQNIKIGDPMLKDTQLGPLARKDLLDTLHAQVRESIEKGATCLTGGRVSERKGYFYEATVLENLSPGMPAYDDELFGPVASLIKVKDLDEAVEIANSSIYGLGGGIFGADEEQLIKIATSRLDTGMININGYGSAEANLPFGGVKDSGYGREFSNLGFHEFVNIKTVMIHSTITD